jgi:hypothetical protein
LMRFSTGRRILVVGLTALLQGGRLVAAVVLTVVSIGVVWVLFSRIPFVNWLLDAFFLGSNPWMSLARITVILVMSVYMGAGASRMLARALPRRADRRVRYSVVVGIGLILVAVAGFFAYVFWPDPAGDAARARLKEDMEAHPMDGDFLDGRAAALGIHIAGMAALMQFGVATTFIVVLPLTLSLIHHVIRRELPGILFLRRFGGRGDSALMAALLRSTPKGTPVAFITSPASTPTSWDPLVIVMAGFRWLRPWSNVPLFLLSSDRRWHEDVQHWIELSRVVVFDSSEPSSSLALERAMILEAGAEQRSIIMTRLPTRASDDDGSIQRGDVTEYELSWLGAAPRVAVGCVCAAYAGYIVFDVIGALVTVSILGLSLAHPSLTASSEVRLQRTLHSVLSSTRSPGSTAGGLEQTRTADVPPTRAPRRG